MATRRRQGGIRHDAERRLKGKASPQLAEARKLAFSPVIDERAASDEKLQLAFRAEKSNAEATKQKARVEEEWATKAKANDARAAERAALHLATAGATIYHLVVVPDLWKGMMGDDWLNNASTRDIYGRHVENQLAREIDVELARMGADIQVTGRSAVVRGRTPLIGSVMRDFLLARRLVEAGVRCVTLNFGGWDTHVANFVNVPDRCDTLDRGLASLLNDLHVRGMLNDTLVVLTSEFGRTPKINQDVGRDHFADAWSCVLAGAGVTEPLNSPRMG